MRKLRLASFLVSSFALAYLFVASGCGGGPKTSPAPTGAAATQTTPPPTGEKTPVEGKGLATVKGKVTYDGEAPKPRDLTDQIKMQQDKDHCLKDDPANPNPGQDRSWVVNSKGEVQYVAIWVRPPAGKFFKFSEDEKKGWRQEVIIDQPFCHFEPHVEIAFTEYYDGATKKIIPSGQKVKVLNSAPISHNTKWAGNPKAVPGGNQTLQAKGQIELELKSHLTTPVTINCDIHKWMQGYLWVLDTPYAAVTKQDGTYEIRNVPAGTDVMLVVWHEQAGFQEGGSQGKKVTLKEGDNEINFKIKAK